MNQIPPAVINRLNIALDAGDLVAICATVNDAIRTQSNVTAVAVRAGVTRSTLYRINLWSNIRMDVLLRVLAGLHLRLSVTPRRRTLLSKAENKALAKALETFDAGAFASACSEILRSQKNVKLFAEEAGMHRATLYRAFMPHRHPHLSTVLPFFSALKVKLKAEPF